MKRNFCQLVVLGMLAAYTGSAQINEDFNARPGVSIANLKGHLQNHCWTLSDLDIKNGMALSGAGSQRTGIYTPVLDVPGKLTVSFMVQGAGKVKVYLTDVHNVVLRQLDSSAAGNYTKTFAGLQPGVYKLFLNMPAHTALDQLAVSANLHYASGCNSSPVARNDYFAGLPNHQATGNVTVNDKDPDQDVLTAYLVNNSGDGQVELRPDGSFTFTPSQGFKGGSTSFSYRVCDDGSGKLCSPNAKVTLSFPSESVSLSDFTGLYHGNGHVALSWATGFEFNSKNFEIERSSDGSKWVTAGSIKAQGTSTEKRAYEFTDEVGKEVALKRDLYYRLKQIDEEGNVAVSRLLIVRVYNTHSVKMMSVTPNPSRNDIAVTTQLNETSFVAMKIFDAAGSMVMNKALKAGAGANSFIMEGSSNLQPGEYMLDVRVNSKERMMVKLIKE